MYNTTTIRPYAIVKSINKAVVATAQDIAISCQTFFITNAGAQPLYITAKEKEGAATTSSFAIPANTTIQVPFTCETLSIISNATGTTASIMIVE